MKKTLFAVLLAIAGIVQAGQFNVWYTDDTIGTPTLRAHLRLTTAGPATTFEDVTGITGDVNGHPITGLVPLGWITHDNMFRLDGARSVVNDGIGFIVDGGMGNVYLNNVGWRIFGTPIYYSYAPSGIPFGANGLDASGMIIGNGDGIHVYLTAIPVPEPATYALFIAGLGLLGLALRKPAS